MSEHINVTTFHPTNNTAREPSMCESNVRSAEKYGVQSLVQARCEFISQVLIVSFHHFVQLIWHVLSRSQYRADLLRDIVTCL